MPDQRGLLEIVRQMVHPEGGRCDKCALVGGATPPDEDLFLSILRDADHSFGKNLFKALFDDAALKTFMR